MAFGTGPGDFHGYDEHDAQLHSLEIKWKQNQKNFVAVQFFAH